MDEPLYDLIFINKAPECTADPGKKYNFDITKNGNGKCVIPNCFRFEKTGENRHFDNADDEYKELNEKVINQFVIQYSFHCQCWLLEFFED
jgi:hypothetical protein